MEGISREEHEEFCKRIEAEDKRQNHRLDLLERNAEQIGALVASVEKLALNMENMLKEQESQGERLGTLESRDGEKWRTVTSYLLTLIAGAVVTYILTKVGI